MSQERPEHPTERCDKCGKYIEFCECNSEEDDSYYEPTEEELWWQKTTCPNCGAELGEPRSHATARCERCGWY